MGIIEYDYGLLVTPTLSWMELLLLVDIPVYAYMLLANLNEVSIGRLAQTCRFWATFIKTNLKFDLWSLNRLPTPKRKNCYGCNKCFENTTPSWIKDNVSVTPFSTSRVYFCILCLQKVYQKSMRKMAVTLDVLHKALGQDHKKLQREYYKSKHVFKTNIKNPKFDAFGSMNNAIKLIMAALRSEAIIFCLLFNCTYISAKQSLLIQHELRTCRNIKIFEAIKEKLRELYRVNSNICGIDVCNKDGRFKGSIFLVKEEDMPKQIYIEEFSLDVDIETNVIGGIITY